MNQFRGFIAVEIPMNTLIKDISHELSLTPANIKLVRLESMHITLKFLGDTKVSDVDRIHQIMKNAVQNHQSFPITLKGIGCFPNRHYIKVIWIGIEQTEQLSAITHSLQTELASLGYKKEKRGFNPHLTLCRVKSAKGKEQLLQIIDGNCDTFFAEVLVDHISLKKSTLTPKGPIYETIATVTF